MSVRSKPAVIGVLVGWFFLFAVMSIVAFCGSCVPMRVGIPRAALTLPTYTVEVNTFCLTGDPFSDRHPQMQMGKGSGVLIDGTHILTAHHVTACPYLADIHVTLSNGLRYRATVDRDWSDRDITRLVLDVPIVVPIVAFAEAIVGAHVCSVVAFPVRTAFCGTVQTVGDGSLSITPDEQGPNANDLMLDLLVFHGNSGGPLYNDHGDLVGIITAGRFGADGETPMGTGFASSVWTIRNELRP